MSSETESRCIWCGFQIIAKDYSMLSDLRRLSLHAHFYLTHRVQTPVPIRSLCTY